MSISSDHLDPATERRHHEVRRRAWLPEAVRAALAVGREDVQALKLAPTDLGTLCRAAADDVVARYPGRTIEYAPDPERTGSGVWDPTRVAYAIAILLEDALQRVSPSDPVQLRWREHGREAVFRVQFPRQLAPGDRMVTVFESGVMPESTSDGIGTLRLIVATRILQQHRGSLARVRTRGGTTYVATLPRRTAAPTEGDRARPARRAGPRARR